MSRVPLRHGPLRDALDDYESRFGPLPLDTHKLEARTMRALMTLIEDALESDAPLQGQDLREIGIESVHRGVYY
ncbi:MAG: hypothetical protein ACM31O_01710 [Bacteroidota bacterium]